MANKNENSFLQYMASGEAGLRYLDVHILVVEVQGIDYECVIIQVRVLMAAGVLEM